jgi:hypothetical protein
MTSTLTRNRALLAALAAVAVLASACGSSSTDEDVTATPIIPVTDTSDDTDDAADDDADDEHDMHDHDPDPGPEPVARPAAKPAATPAATPVTKPVSKPVAKPAATPVSKPAALADGAHEGRIVTITTTSVTLDLVEVLTGEEAVAAAKADGHPLDDDGTLPNDVYVRDLKERVVMPITGDGGFQVYDCTNGCELVGTTLAALVDGSTVPYGGAEAPFSVRVDHGVVDSLVEIYLP